jgi:hypothetical protein
VNPLPAGEDQVYSVPKGIIFPEIEEGVTLNATPEQLVPVNEAINACG